LLQAQCGLLQTRRHLLPQEVRGKRGRDRLPATFCGGAGQRLILLRSGLLWPGRFLLFLHAGNQCARVGHALALRESAQVLAPGRDGLIRLVQRKCVQSALIEQTLLVLRSAPVREAILLQRFLWLLCEAITVAEVSAYV